MVANEYPEFEIIVVDNGSSDGSADAVEAQHPTARLVRLQENLGFAGGMNAGVRAAFAEGADAVLLLNNDMEVEPGCVEPLVAALAVDPSAGAACAQILFAGKPPRGGEAAYKDEGITLIRSSQRTAAFSVFLRKSSIATAIESGVRFE